MAKTTIITAAAAPTTKTTTKTSDIESMVERIRTRRRRRKKLCIMHTEIDVNIKRRVVGLKSIVNFLRCTSVTLLIAIGC